jgi:hypothetical protein
MRPMEIFRLQRTIAEQMFLPLAKCVVSSIGLAVIAWSLFPKSAIAQKGLTDRALWDYDSNEQQTAPHNPVANEVAAILSGMDDRWNAHNLGGYLEVFWQSPRMLVVSDATVINGFQELRNSYERGFTDLESMGTLHANRIQIRMIRSDLAVAVSRWTFFFPKSSHETFGIDTIYLKHFDVGWKVIFAHSTTADH